MTTAMDELLGILDLERLEHNLYRGRSPKLDWQRVFGGQTIAQASRDKDEVLTADLDLDMIAEVRKTWQFFRDRRPDMYDALVKP